MTDFQPNVFAFMYLDLDEISDQQAQERISCHIRREGLNPESFHFHKFKTLPEKYVDSFSHSFVEAASHLNTGYSLVVASLD